jgi:hypothetical protein
METSPVALSQVPDDSSETERGAMDAVQHGLRFLKYGIAGAIGAIATVNTIAQLRGIDVVDSTQIIAALCGAVAMIAIARRSRIL